MNKYDELIKKYDLIPHPEGGYYKEVYRSKQKVNSSYSNEERNTITHIYFLLTKGQFSRFHRVVHDEIWNFYEGAALKLIEYNGKEVVEKIIGDQNDYVSVVKGGIFQAAETMGEYTLVGCSVAPGFDFKDFTFLTSEPVMLENLESNYLQYKRLV